VTELPYVKRSSRRMFLRGATAATAIPFLPSLVSDAEAQVHSYERVVFVAWSHGVYAPLFQPSVPGFSDTSEARVRTASMRDATQGLYWGNELDGLEDKCSFLLGVGQIGAWGHQSSVAFTASERGPDERYRVTATHPISIDNVLARSSAVYPTAPEVDVLRLSMGNNDGTHSFVDRNWVPCVDAEVAYAQLFDGGTSAPSEPAGPTPQQLAARRRLNVVERTLAQYRGVLASGRLSAADRMRLEQSMTHYASLEASLRARVEGGETRAPTSACEPFTLSGSDDSDAKMRDHARLFAQAFACTGTRIGYWKLSSSHADVDGAHQAASGANRRGDGLYTRIMQRNCRSVGTLLREMDGIVEGNGRTMLDNSLVVVTSDMSTSVIGEHPGVDAPFLIAGGLGGKLRMGEVIDYRDLDHRISTAHDHEWFAGPPHNELLISIMRAFGLEQSDWGGPGFGQYQCVRDETCTDDRPGRAQGDYVRYYHGVHADRRAPGAELPYFRVG